MSILLSTSKLHLPPPPLHITSYPYTPTSSTSTPKPPPPYSYSTLHFHHLYTPDFHSPPFPPPLHPHSPPHFHHLYTPTPPPLPHLYTPTPLPLPLLLRPRLLYMGCYGIGVSRLLAAAVENLSNLSEDTKDMTDEQIKWPISIAPYKFCVIPQKVSLHLDN